MSAKIKPSFKADEKTYELIYTRALQVEYQKMVEAKKQDSEYQKVVAEYTRLQSEYESIHEQYVKAKDAYLSTPLDKEVKALYRELKEADKEAFDAFNAFSAIHPDGDGRDFVIYAIGKLVLLALQEQYKLDEKSAEAIWNKYVEENGETAALLFLSCVGTAWFTDMDEDSENPFIVAQMKRIDMANNRRIGLNKINK